MFSVTYEIVTPESAKIGDAEERGFISQGVTLREAFRDVLEVRCGGHCGGIESIEASCSELTQARWLTVYNGQEYDSGAFESRSLHWPDHVTPASRARIVRLVQRG